MIGRKLYTIILDYKGGTYVSQARGVAARQALRTWASSVKHRELLKWKITRAELRAVIESDEPTALRGLLGVWCTASSTKGGLALINVIATDSTTKG